MAEEGEGGEGEGMLVGGAVGGGEEGECISQLQQKSATEISSISQ